MYGAISIVSGLGAIWSLTVLTLERALVIGRPGYGGAGKVTSRGPGMFQQGLGNGLALVVLTHHHSADHHAAGGLPHLVRCSGC